MGIQKETDAAEDHQLRGKHIPEKAVDKLAAGIKYHIDRGEKRHALFREFAALQKLRCGDGEHITQIIVYNISSYAYDSNQKGNFSFRNIFKAGVKIATVTNPDKSCGAKV